MTRKEYELVFQAFKSYRCYMTKEQEALSEKILDDLFYPEFDKLATEEPTGITQEMVDASLKTPMWYETEGNDNDDNEIKSLNFTKP